jgi:3-isopropylmalate dehydratase small subunit
LFSAASLVERLACTQEDVILGAVPFSNAFGISPTILATALAGAQLVCQPRFNAGETLQLIEKTGVTILHGVPTMFTLQLNHPEFREQIFESVRTGIMAGAPCPSELVKRVRKEMQCNLLVAYGLTEASPSVACTQLTDGPVTAVETAGRPHAGVEIKALGPDGKPVPDGQEGELYVRGPNVMLGYWDDPQATASVLDEMGWLKTGDQGSIDPDGPLRISGRLDNVINRGGFKIYPLPIEMWLRAHPEVKDAAVVGVPDLIYGELSVACIVRTPGSAITEQELSAYIQTSFADYALPNRILFFEILPRRGSGPVRRKYLSERVRIRGRAWKFGNNIDTDAIIPARRCNTADARELALYCMEDADPDFIEQMERGDLIVAGNNFGCGSSREVAPLSIKAAGVSGVIAKSFARIFFRNAINIGLPILECPQAVEGIQPGDEIEVEPAGGTVRNLSSGEIFQAEPFPDFLQRIIERGGLLAYVEDRLEGEVLT